LKYHKGLVFLKIDVGDGNRPALNKKTILVSDNFCSLQEEKKDRFLK
jgi:hypothetical protein